MDYTAIFILFLVGGLFLAFNAILAKFADHLPEWILPKGYYDNDR